MNALRHGHRSRAWVLLARRIRRAIRLCAQTVLLVRVRLLHREPNLKAPEGPIPAMPVIREAPQEPSESPHAPLAFRHVRGTAFHNARLVC